MGPVGWEGRASSYGAEVSGCSETVSVRAGAESRARSLAAGGSAGGDESLGGVPGRGLEAHTQLRGSSWGSVPGLGVVPCRQLPEGAPLSCHGACKVPPFPEDPQILEVNMSLRRGPVSLPDTMVKNSTYEIRV